MVLQRLLMLGCICAACCAYCWAFIAIWTAMFCLILPSCLGLFAVCFSCEVASLLLGKFEMATPHSEGKRALQGGLKMMPFIDGAAGTTAKICSCISNEAAAGINCVQLLVVSAAASTTSAHTQIHCMTVLARYSVIRRRKVSLLSHNPALKSLHLPSATVGTTKAAGGATEVKPSPHLDLYPCHLVVPTELPQHWDPMPEGAEVHEVVIYDNPDGMALPTTQNDLPAFRSQKQCPS